jgi:hypothetical protein
MHYYLEGPPQSGNLSLTPQNENLFDDQATFPAIKRNFLHLVYGYDNRSNTR